MKRSRLQRKTPLARGGYIVRKRPRRLSRAGSNPAYLASVRAMACFLDGATVFPCEGMVHAHHAIHRSQGGKDQDAIPLCARHHRDWHECTGPFRSLSRFERFAWSMRVIAATQAAYQGTAR